MIIERRPLLRALLMVLALSPAALSAERVVAGDNISSGKFGRVTQEEYDQRSSAGLAAPGTQGGWSNLVQVKIPASFTGTGLHEWIEYQLPPGYNPNGSPYPMVVCWHGYSQSFLSVSIDSSIDEECYTRGWIFLSIHGAHQCNFGYPTAQVHCTKAIDYMINQLGFHVDTDRIYMAGYSMGGCAAASYASRHLSEEGGYPVAGLILVASLYDLTDAYKLGDPGVQQWLPVLLGDVPSNMPFAYKQISTLTIDDHTYVADESMGRNLKHNLPVFVTYAGNDTLSYGTYQNGIFVQMLADLGATYMLDYYAQHPTPHHWQLLDVQKAFDFVEQYSLSDQQTDSIAVLADRDAEFYWAGAVQNAYGAFSKIVGEADGADNALGITEADNLDALDVDVAKAGLGDQKPLKLTYQSSFPLQQEIRLSPVPTEPTYVVDSGGLLHPGYGYSGDEVSIVRPASTTLDLKISFEPYLLSLAADAQAFLGQGYALGLSGGNPFDLYILFFAFDQRETLLVKDRHLLVNPFAPATVWFFNALGASGDFSIPINVPNDPGLNGTVLYQQFLTYDSALKEISNLAETEIAQ